jgi:hypothetical protein
VRLAAVLVAAVLAGCSPVQRIAANALAIRDEAQSLEAHGVEVGDPVVVASAGRIQVLAGGIQGDLGGIQDRTPSWVTAIMYGGAAIIAVAVVVVLWQTQLGTLIRVAIGWLPRRKVTQAQLAVDMLDPSRPEGDRELVAAMRAQDPEFDAAYRKAQQRKKNGTSR